MVIFSHKMNIPKNITDIKDKEAILLKLIKDETSLVEDLALLGF